MRSALWPTDWNSVGGGAGSDIAPAAAQSSMSHCRQPSTDIIQSGHEPPYANMLSVHGSGAGGGTQVAAEFGDLASMFTGFME